MGNCSCSTLDEIPPLSGKQKPDVLEKAAVPIRALRNKKAGLGEGGSQ